MKKINIFLQSKYFILLVSIVYLLMYMINKPIIYAGISLSLVLGLIFVMTTITYSMLFLNNAKPLVPTLTLFIYNLGFLTNIEYKKFQMSAIYIISFLFLYLIILLVIHIIKFKKKIVITKLNISLLLFVLMPIFTYIIFPSNLVIFGSFIGLVYYMFYMLIFNTTSIKDNIEYISYLVLAIVVILIVETLFYMGSFFVIKKLPLNIESIKVGIRSSWSVGGHNQMGYGSINQTMIHLLFFSPILIYFTIKNKNKLSYFYLFLSVAVIIAISGSRGALLSFLLFLPVYIYYLIKYTKSQLRLNILFLLLVVLIFLIVNYNFVSVIVSNLSKNFSIKDLDKYSSGRINLYKIAIEIFKESPVIGMGLRSTDAIRGQLPFFHFHQTFLHQLAVGGIIGLLILLVFIYQSVKLLFNKTYTKSQSLMFKLIFIGYLSSQVYGLTDNTYSHQAYMFVYVSIFALIDTITKKKITLPKHIKKA